MIEQVKKIAYKAGQEILDVYKDVNPDIKYKKDDSPVTEADIVSNEIILKELKNISDYPVLSEETVIPYEKRRNWNKFWLIDPLDGTKDFLAKNNQFTVNIALVENSKPVLGVVLIPAEGLCYWAQRGKGAFKNNKKIYNNSKRVDLIGSDSNFHSTEQTINFYKTHKISAIRRYGSALKFCKLSEGEIDVYARLNGTMEWDTAAGHIIMNESGCKIIDIQTKKEIFYNRENLVNNHFIASRNDLEFLKHSR